MSLNWGSGTAMKGWTWRRAKRIASDSALYEINRFWVEASRRLISGIIIRHYHQALSERIGATTVGMGISARNQLAGTIEDIQVGDIMAHVVVKVGDNLIESIITRNSVEELGLKKGDHVKVVVKSTEVMIQKG